MAVAFVGDGSGVRIMNTIFDDGQCHCKSGEAFFYGGGKYHGGKGIVTLIR